MSVIPQDAPYSLTADRQALRQRIRIDAEAANLKVDIHDPDDE